MKTSIINRTRINRNIWSKAREIAKDIAEENNYDYRDTLDKLVEISIFTAIRLKERNYNILKTLVKRRMQDTSSGEENT